MSDLGGRNKSASLVTQKNKENLTDIRKNSSKPTKTPMIPSTSGQSASSGQLGQEVIDHNNNILLTEINRFRLAYKIY